MTAENKLKLLTLLNELYEQGETPEDIVEVITDELLPSECIDLIEDILTGVKDKDTVNDFIEKAAINLIEHSNLYAESLIGYFDADTFYKALSGADGLEDFMVTELNKDDYLRDSVLSSIDGEAVYFAPKMLTLDKYSRLEGFIMSLFPYQNEQSQIQMNF
jgi:hypothetical protein